MIVGHNNIIVLAQSDVVTVYMCPGDMLNLTCGTNQALNFLRWNVSAPALGISRESQLLFVEISSINVIKISSVTFNISLLNGTMNYPLRSEVFAENVTADLNGTIITCLEILIPNGVPITRVVSATRIHIIGNQALHSKLSQYKSKIEG